MKISIRSLLAVVGLVVILSACSQATGNSNGTNSGPLSGKVNNQSFTSTFASATASTTVSGSYDVTFTSNSSYPTVGFTVAPQVKTYTVTTFGTNGGLSVMAALDGFNFIAFDSGTVTITKFDTSAKVIEGSFSNVNTTDGESSLSGTFSVSIIQ